MIRFVGVGLAGVVALAGCKVKNELSCELVDNMNLPECGGSGVDAPPDGQACEDNTQCGEDVCGPDGLCVECVENTDCDDPAEPTCDATHACRPCVAHTDCDSNACLPNGQCASDVAYVAQNGSGVECSQATPCATLNEAFNTNRAVVKVNGTAAVPLTGKITIDAAKVRTLLGDPGAKVSAAFADALFVVSQANTSLTVAGLQVIGNSGSGDGFALSNATLVLERTIIRDIGAAGVAVRGSNGTLVMNRSILAQNDGSGINVQNTAITMRNNLIVQNGKAGQNTRGLEMNPAPGAIFEFNTIAENAGLTTAAINCAPGVAGANNIVFGGIGSVSGQCAFTFSLFDTTPPTGMGNKMGTPTKFEDRSTVDGTGFFRITSDSEAIDGANPNSAITDDIDGSNTRPTGAAPDIGADEL